MVLTKTIRNGALQQPFSLAIENIINFAGFV